MARRSTSPEATLHVTAEADDVQNFPADDSQEIDQQGRLIKRGRTDVGDSTYSAPTACLGQVNRKNVEIHPRGKDGYIPGSIVRIQLENFVTYDYIQFFPGTHLNMIIGPNGTGRSSIASAIALGLNFPPSVLGRASVLGSFVKHGAEKGYIEIELKGPEGVQNLVIRRHLQSDSKLSSFTLNGCPVSGLEIKKKMAELNVQVGNLCSFLIQDRVSEFSFMSPQELLRETQSVAGDENLTSWHDTLIRDGKNIREIREKIRDEENALNQMKQRNEGIERDVQQYKDWKKIEHETPKIKLEMNLHTNPGMVEQYEKRKIDIEVLKKSIEESKRKEAIIAKNIKSTVDSWQPVLQSLVSRIGTRFSSAFDRIGCVGEIQINRDEDYEKWGVDILVKFRDSDGLQLLTPQRQSSGERSLTTILYLLSLMEEAHAPFSLVDEINQGMNQRTERAVHNSIVNITCQPNSAQYFLITSNLLPDLEYHDRMKILCLNNGEWLSDINEQAGVGNMMKMIDRFQVVARGR